MRQADQGASLFSPPLSRRFLMVSGAVAFGGAALPWSISAAAAADDRFMTLSRLLIPHSLDPVIGARIAADLATAVPRLADHLDTLLDLARAKQATIVEEFFPDAPEDAKATALRIISAWYLGVVDDVPGARIVAYELALMFKPTSDVMTIPTYAISGPNGWDAEAPPLDVMPNF